MPALKRYAIITAICGLTFIPFNPLFAAQAPQTQVICATPQGQQNTFSISWDNANQFFADNGYIPRLFCEGGYARPYTVYVSDNLADQSLGYFNGVVVNPTPTPSPTPTASPTSEPTPSPSPSPSETATASPSPTVEPSPSPTPDATTPSSEPVASPTATSTPSPSPDASIEPSPQSSPSETPTQSPEPQPSPSPSEPPHTTFRSTVDEGGVLVLIAPSGFYFSGVIFASYGTPENYIIGSCHAENSLAIVTQALTPERLEIAADNGVFGDPCGGTYKRLSVILNVAESATATSPSTETTTQTVESATAETPQPTPEPSPSPTPTPEPARPEPVVVPVPQPVIEPTPSPEPEPSVSPSPEPEPTPEPSPTPTVEPSDEPSAGTPSEQPSPEPSSEPSPTPQPETETTEPTATPSPEPSLPPKEEEPSAVVDEAVSDALKDGKLTEAEKEVIAEAIIEEFKGEPVPASALAAAGITYADLPPATPVEVRTDAEGNPVVITAEVAAALEVLEDPAALVGAIFTDPAQAILALGSVGADMSPQEREKAKKTAVVAIVAGAVASTAVAGAAGVRRKP